MNNLLLQYDINYSLSENISYEILLSNSILPIKNEELCVLIATSREVIDYDEIKLLFHKPIKFILVEKKELNKELQYLGFKQKLFNLASDSITHLHKENENSYIMNFMKKIFSFSIKKM